MRRGFWRGCRGRRESFRGIGGYRRLEGASAAAGCTWKEAEAEQLPGLHKFQADELSDPALAGRTVFILLADRMR